MTKYHQICDRLLLEAVIGMLLKPRPFNILELLLLANPPDFQL